MSVRRHLNPRTVCLVFVALVTLTVFSGCSGMFNKLADNLSNGILNQNDPETVRDGAPAYLLMIDGFIEGNPESKALLMAGAKLNSSYASVFVDDPIRAKKMSEKALNYGMRAVCIDTPSFCEKRFRPLGEFEEVLNEMKENNVPALYTCGSAWAGWIQANSDDYNAIADLSKVKAVMVRVMELDESFDQGGAHMYLGVLSTLVPPALGGKPEEGRMHFEKAIELSGGKNLMAKVMYAKQYARLMFNRDLHDRLLNEVMKADPNVPKLTLINTFAQHEAEELLLSADEYF